MKRSLVLVLIFQCVISFVLTEQSHYRAAVVEFAPKLSGTPTENLQWNVQEYVKNIKTAAAQGAQIIVFPEFGLTGWRIIYDTNVMDEVSASVPEPDQNISPCDDAQDSKYSKALVDLSCAARANKIYLVANMVEKRYGENHTKIFHNANVVFDRKGRVIARYRKINLFNEDAFTAGDEVVTFETDFGVKFGMFICFDIMFKNPALDVLADAEINDVVYSVAWISELPFLESLSVHHGYATSTGINMLSSCFHDPSTKNGGSAIYLTGGDIAEGYMSASPGPKLIIRDVPIKPSSSRDSCRTPVVHNKQIISDDNTPIGKFHTSEENMTDYTFKSLDLAAGHISETICSGKFCCSFETTVTKDPDVEPNYVYKLAAFHGARFVAETDSMGLRNCALVACLNESSSSCGGRSAGPPKGIAFENLAVKGVFPAKDSHDQPVTVNYDLKPVDGYTFCRKQVGEDVEVVVSTEEKQESLLSFGILGRVFSNDNEAAGVIKE